MSILITPGQIGNLLLPNRIVRSATAERLARNVDGKATSRLREMWVELARGGTGLIITGHMFIHESGKCHPEMTGIHRDDLIPDLASLAEAVHREGGLIAAQINHGGLKCSPETVNRPFGPSAIEDETLLQPGRRMTDDEIYMVIESFAQAARRVKEVGFDAVQLHGAHGYLINQFLSSYTNRRTDQWGGDPERRLRFLKEVTTAVRQQVGPEYPVLIKFGAEDGVDGGLTGENSAFYISQFGDLGLDGLELSGGFRSNNIRKGINKESKEAYYRHLAKIARASTDLPILLVGGMRSRRVMEEVLYSGDVDFISMCRPLINDPNFPNLLKSGKVDKSACISSSNCWAIAEGDGIGCKCPPL